jgi:hypothetical protein
MQTPEEIHEQVKEVFAYFGRAFYAASCVETGLAIALMQVDFMTKVREQFQRAGTFDRMRYETDFDTFMNNQHAQTLGNLIRRVEMFSCLDDQLVGRLREAKKRRDFLSHHYFRERAQEFAVMNGRNGMIAELEQEHEFFEVLDRDVQAALSGVREQLGMKDEMMQAHFEEIKKDVEKKDAERGARAGPGQ